MSPYNQVFYYVNPDFHMYLPHLKPAEGWWELQNIEYVKRTIIYNDPCETTDEFPRFFDAIYPI